MTQSAEFQPLSIRAAVQLAAPHTWVAAVAPVLVGAALSWSLAFPASLLAHPLPTSLLIVVLMLVTSIALQSAVNTFNDYTDFIKGVDTTENVIDSTDASILYNHLDPAAVKRFGFALLAVAALSGFVLVSISTWMLLILGLIGAITVLLYSFGPTPISYLPLGEVISGVVMGGIITVGTMVALSTLFDPWMFFYALPLILGIGVIMQVNNTCDMEKDRAAGRHTLPIVLGRERSIQVIVVLSALAIIIIALVGAFRFPFGFIAFLLLGIPLARNLLRLRNDQYSVQSRSAVMKTAVLQVALATVCYITMIAIGVLYHVIT